MGRWREYAKEIRYGNIAGGIVAAGIYLAAAGAARAPSGARVVGAVQCVRSNLPGIAMCCALPFAVYKYATLTLTRDEEPEQNYDKPF